MVSFLKKSPQAIANIQFDSKPDHEANLSTPGSWLSNEDITGCAIYKLPTPVDFARSKIMLRGIVTTRTNEYPSDALQPKWRTEEHTFIAVALTSKPQSDFLSKDGVVRIPFSFNLSDCQVDLSSARDLPPSLKSKDESRWWSSHDSGYQYDIIYRLTASIYSSRGLAASTTEELSILPVSESRPPVSPSDFPGEYFLAAGSGLKTKSTLAKGPNYRTEVRAQEPEPVVLRAKSSLTSNSTNVSFIVKLSPFSGALDKNQLPTQCQVKACLVTTTLVTPNGGRGAKIMPTVEQVHNGADSYVKSHKSHEQEYTVAIRSWERCNFSLTESFLLADLSFLFQIAGDKLPCSTFFTPLLSRRYSIDMTIKLPESSSKNLRLSLPLQILYSAGGTTSIDQKKILHVHDDVAVLPQYSQCIR